MAQLVAADIETTYREAFPVSAKLAVQGRNLFPNGVTHDGRHLTPFPVYVERAEGAYKWSAEGTRLIDYWMGHGSLLLGHSHPAVVDAVSRQVRLGTHLGSCHEREIEWGEVVRELMPACERIRFVNSGTEATLMALRLSRIVTGRQKVLKFAGHFHGWHDLLIPGADGPYTPEGFQTPGVTSGVMDDLVIIPPNDLSLVEQAIDQHKPACLILEATGGHWGLVPMRGPFLTGVRELTRKKGVILIFDEVITGFRVSPGGSQGHYGVVPDMTTMAKILAGGLPGGALGGRTDLMQALEFGNSYGKKMKHPGTYNGNPLSAAAGVAALRLVADTNACEVANQRAADLRRGLNRMFVDKSVNWIAYGEFSWANILPEYEGPPSSGDADIPCGNSLERLDRKFDAALTTAFRQAILMGGVDLFGGWRAMLSSKHTEDDVVRTVAACAEAIDRLRAQGLVS